MIQAKDDSFNVQNQLHMNPCDPMLSSQECAAAAGLRKVKNDLGIYLSQLAEFNSVKFADENSYYCHQSIRQENLQIELCSFVIMGSS